MIRVLFLSVGHVLLHVERIRSSEAVQRLGSGDTTAKKQRRHLLCTSRMRRELVKTCARSRCAAA